MTPRLAITCGDVNGIGLECFLRAVPSLSLPVELQLLVDVSVLKRTISLLGLPATIDNNILRIGSASIAVVDLDHPVPLEFGRMSSAAGGLAIAALESAAERVESGQADGVVTLPISKEACILAGFDYPGQTEFFGARWGGVPIMILAWHHVRVALATVHVSLRKVPALLSIDHVSERLATLEASLRTDFGVTTPRIGVLGLNPHAGENGTIGRSESTVIGPAIEVARSIISAGSRVEGPFPADGFFGFGMYEQFDGILAMYHDQGLIPLKLLARGGGVNVTAGLNYVRTSPDHGTAFSIAGTGKADAASTLEAIEMAAAIVERRSRPAAASRIL